MTDTRDALTEAILTTLREGNPLYYEDAADELADALVPVVDRLRRETAATPRLGLATTRELLAELAARIEVDGANGGGGLDYSTTAAVGANTQED